VASELAKGCKKKTSLAAAVIAISMIGLGSNGGAALAQTAGTAKPGDACTTQNGMAGTINAENACVAPTNSQEIIQPRAITPKIALDDTYIKVLAGESTVNVAAKATGYGAIAIGSGAVAGLDAGGVYDTVAIGLVSKATGNYSTALGRLAEASGASSLAAGNTSAAKAANSVALGYAASVDAAASNSVALGSNSVATEANTFSVGSSTLQRKIVNLADGTLSSTSTDAVTGKQLYATNQDVATNKANIATNTADIATNKANIATNTTDIATNKANIATNTTNITSLTDQISNGSVGLVKQDATTQAITVASTTGGTNINFAGTGGNRVLSGIGNGTGDSDAVTIAQLKAAGLWDPASNRPLLSLVYDDLTMGTARLGGTKGTVLRNLGNGSIAHGSMEAINGGQLFDFQQDVKNQMDALTGQVNALTNQVNQINQGLNDGSLGGAGGAGTGTDSTALGEGSNASGAGSTAVGTGANATGTNSTATGANSVASGTNSTANGNGAQALGNNSTATGANAIASGEGSTANGANAVASGNNSTALGSNATASADNSVALGANSTADRDNTVSVGSVGAERQITNVAAGTERTDAANWGQVQDAVQGAKDWASRKFEQVDRRMDSVGAMGAAMSQMAFSAQGVDKVNRIGVGVGRQGSQSAIALGYSHQILPNLNVSVGGSMSGSEKSVGAGMAFGW